MFKTLSLCIKRFTTNNLPNVIFHKSLVEKSGFNSTRYTKRNIELKSLILSILEINKIDNNVVKYVELRSYRFFGTTKSLFENNIILGIPDDLELNECDRKWHCSYKSMIQNHKFVLNENQLTFVFNHEIGHHMNGDLKLYKFILNGIYKYSPIYLSAAYLYLDFANLVPIIILYNHIYALYSQGCEFAADKYAVTIKPETKHDAIDFFTGKCQSEAIFKNDIQKMFYHKFKYMFWLKEIFFGSTHPTDLERILNIQ